MHELSERKSFVTVNTSQLNQALVGGVLLQQDCSLAAYVQPALQFYRHNRDVLVAALTRELGDTEVRWNVPAGGFFMSLQLPFDFHAEEMIACARDHQVLVMPMTFFALDSSRRNSVRMAYSNVSPDQIEAGVQRLSTFIKRRLAGN
jgi:(S)-3,5-dihydroxyphenylglycine transaminase